MNGVYVLKKLDHWGKDLFRGIDEKVEDSLPKSREKAKNPSYSGCATNGQDAPATAYHAVTASGPHISLKIAQGVAFSFDQNRNLNSWHFCFPYHCTRCTFSWCIYSICSHSIQGSILNTTFSKA
jgi:hypothetical protein